MLGLIIMGELLNKTYKALWTAVIAGAVLGRIIDPEQAEVVDQNPEITKEQAAIWSSEFFRSAVPVGASHTEQLRPSSYYYASEDPSGRSVRRFEHYPETLNYNTPSRSNMRHYDVSGVNLSVQSGKKPIIKKDNLEWMLQNIFTYPRSHVTNETAKNIVKKYISDSFQYTSGLPTSVQHFKPLQFLSIYEGNLPLGANIISVIKGSTWSTAEDRPVVVGAHWDTVNFTPGTDDNGSGVAAMLETARAIAHSGCRPKFSIIFVAFDLEETGSQGSLIFIKEYLMKIIQSAEIPKPVSFSNFQGAFIMDTIMDFNDTEGSQTFPTDWSLVLPDVYSDVADENYKGDFLSMIYRSEVDHRMAEKFNTHWTKSTHNPKFRIKKFPLVLKADLPELEILADHLNFLRSDHARFWYMNDTEVPYTLNAVLITDTGPYRGNMRNCYHTVCDGPEVSVYDNPTNMEFLAKTTQALADTLVDMSECAVQDSGKVGLKTDPQSRAWDTLSNSSRRNRSPLRSLLHLVKWLQQSES